MTTSYSAKVYGILAAIRTLLNNYPSLSEANFAMKESVVSFMFNILKVFGVAEERLIEFLTDLLSDKKGTNCFLYTLETAIKTVILKSIKETYTCEVNPMLPDAIMSGNTGIIIPISVIDTMGTLLNCPTDKAGSIFYFDNEKENGYTPSNIYSSTDCNAFLWYIINRSSYIEREEEGNRWWDNRVFYAESFKKDNSLVGDFAENTNKGNFFSCDTSNLNSSVVAGLGMKYSIINFELVGRNNLRIKLNGNRYSNVLLPGTTTTVNKTVFEFDFDYINSLKLFDAKTLITQITNSLIGLLTHTARVSLERLTMEEFVRDTIRKIITEETEGSYETVVDDCYFSFTNEEYNEMLNRALQKYNGKYQSNYKEYDVNSEAIIDEIYKISNAEDLNAEKTIIENTFRVINSTVTEEEESWDKFDWNIILEFINELCVDLAMQVLSPKVMVLYAINDYIIEGNEHKSGDNMLTIMRQYWNMIRGIIRKIYEMVVNEVYQFYMNEIKPLLIQFGDKVVGEALFYYRELMDQLMYYYRLYKSSTKKPLELDEITGADIAPMLDAPNTANC